jgi:hypothetical protein
VRGLPTGLLCRVIRLLLPPGDKCNGAEYRSVNLYMPLLSGDYESQVKGYQYSMGTITGSNKYKGLEQRPDFDHGWITTYASRSVRIRPGACIQYPGSIFPQDTAVIFM